jgi:nitrite reductase/ring-hydroxylating ferredoxin subunit
MSKLIKVAETKDVSPGTAKVVQAEGRSIALFNVAGGFCAIDNDCSHVGGPLGEGELAGEVVTCPWHGAKFNVKTGEVLGPPARKGVQSFPVKVQGNDVFVELE